jgi:hypothetical protein
MDVKNREEQYMLRATQIIVITLLLLSCEHSATNPDPIKTNSDLQPTHSNTRQTNLDTPPILYPPLDDAPEIFMNTYYGAVGASAPTPQNPQGIHQGMDFVAPTGTPVKATTSGTISRITTEIKTEYDSTVNTYGEVWLDMGGNNTIIYIFEPLQSLSVVEGQVVDTGDTLGTLADNRGQNIRGTPGTGTLDFGLMSCADATCMRICFVPYAAPFFKTLMETWFSRAYTVTAEHPGPCVCHYRYPQTSVSCVPVGKTRNMN